jgi:hypothetical protein
MQATRDATDNSRILAVEQLPAALCTAAVGQTRSLNSVIRMLRPAAGLGRAQKQCVMHC